MESINFVGSVWVGTSNWRAVMHTCLVWGIIVKDYTMVMQFSSSCQTAATACVKLSFIHKRIGCNYSHELISNGTHRTIVVVTALTYTVTTLTKLLTLKGG